MAKLETFILLILSPTRLWIDWKKNGKSDKDRAKLLWCWNAYWFRLEIVFCTSLVVVSALLGNIPARIGAFSVVIFYLAFSRASEVSFAFVKDVWDRLGEVQERTVLTSGERILMALRSYVGLAVNFSIMFYFLPPPTSSSNAMPLLNATNFFDVVYFSVMTITTTGYGDIMPLTAPAKMLAMWEVLSGLLVIAVAFAVYLSRSSRPEGKKR